jgi:hypothetical protein
VRDVISEQESTLGEFQFTRHLGRKKKIAGIGLAKPKCKFNVASLIY